MGYVRMVLFRYGWLLDGCSVVCMWLQCLIISQLLHAFLCQIDFYAHLCRTVMWNPGNFDVLGVLWFTSVSETFVCPCSIIISFWCVRKTRSSPN